MAPLSKDLSGLILPHGSVGSHSDDSGKTIDEDLEKQNFRKTGEILTEVWSNTVIDTHPVHAEYLENAQVDSAYTVCIAGREM